MEEQKNEQDQVQEGDQTEPQDQAQTESTNQASNDQNAQQNKPLEGQEVHSKSLNAALTYAFGWITGLIFLLAEKDDDFVRFHAAQSLLFFGAMTLLSFVPLINLIVIVIDIVMWIVLMVNAYQGKRMKLPLFGEYAESLKDKIGK